MNLQQRIELMEWLGKYLTDKDESWQNIVQQAFRANPWFTPEFTDVAVDNIVQNYLQKSLLSGWTKQYHIDDNISQKKVGIVMAGNIPLVGFHDLLSVFICGHNQVIKLSSKDNILLKHIITKLESVNNEVGKLISISEMLKGCDAYIATGSNNSARYFEQYFAAWPHIIRRNKTSVAVLTGNETREELDKLSDDIHFYFGLGCRNVTKIYVPENYDFIPLLASFDKYKYFRDHHKYSNNYDYRLSILLLNNKYYMTNGSTLLTDDPSPFSAISVLNYETYNGSFSADAIPDKDRDIQCIIGHGFVPFGNAQRPALTDYADNVDTMQFLLGL
jgi:hypothetical protein